MLRPAAAAPSWRFHYARRACLQDESLWHKRSGAHESSVGREDGAETRAASEFITL